MALVSRLKKLLPSRSAPPAVEADVTASKSIADTAQTDEAPRVSQDASAADEASPEALSLPEHGDESFDSEWARHERIIDAARHEPERMDAVQMPGDDPDMRNLFSQWEAAAIPDNTPAPTQEVGNISVEDAAEILIGGGAARAIFISPEGDEGAAASVMVAREVADAGLRVLLVDLTTTGAASGPMLDGEALPGITDLLASEALFSDAIHPDLYSECYVMPVGTAEPVEAMKSAHRLPAIMETLTMAYDLVVVECGASDARGIRRLVADGTEIMVSATGSDKATIGAAEDVQAMGHSRVMVVSLSTSQAQNPSFSASEAASAI